MKIIVDNGVYGLGNVGDIAMLQVAVSRLHQLFPNALIQVLTSEPKRLLSLCPEARALITKGRGFYLEPWNILGGTNRLVPSFWHQSFLDAEHWLRMQFPNVAIPWIKHRLGRCGKDVKLIDEYLEILFDADLVVASGGGYINDSFPRHAEIVLRTLQLAQHLKKPTALLGQGIGPLTNKRLRGLAKEVLRGVNLIGLREKPLGLRLLSELNVPHERVVVTGDDAIELVYQNRSECLGSDIGINIRLASYSQVSDEQVNMVRSILHEFADKVSSKMRPVPISYYSNMNPTDLESIAALLDQQSNEFEVELPNNLATPETVIKAAGACRIVVTGSYHAAVFALSQGIPAVGLVNSAYYVAKFLGLQQQFGEGIDYVVMDSPKFPVELKEAIEKAWTSAEMIRPQLLKAAQRQLYVGTDFYSQLVQLVK